MPAIRKKKSAPKQKPVCPICQSVLGRGSSLNRHLRIHGKRAFRCPYEGCPFDAHEKVGLQRHLERHEGKRHCCGMGGCLADFADPSGRTRHQQKVHHKPKRKQKTVFSTSASSSKGKEGSTPEPQSSKKLKSHTRSRGAASSKAAHRSSTSRRPTSTGEQNALPATDKRDLVEESSATSNRSRDISGWRVICPPLPRGPVLKQ